MTTLVVGASGATGRQLVGQLLDRGEPVRAVVRDAERLPADLREREGLSLVVASLLDLSDHELQELVRDCRGVASCLGHNLSFRGVFGSPRRLVTQATRRLCAAVTAGAPGRPVRFVLMNSAGCSNRDLDEPLSLAQRFVIGSLRVLLPPHVDNEQAAELLRTEIGSSHAAVEWVVVRPDTLVDEIDVHEYQVHASPTRSAIFDPGKTRRIHVAHFMAELVTNDELWREWRGKMPVIYDTES